MDDKFVKYFREKYPQVGISPVENFPWYVNELQIWEACKKAYNLKNIIKQCPIIKCLLRRFNTDCGFYKNERCTYDISNKYR